jgi:hypothetical protein
VSKQVWGSETNPFLGDGGSPAVIAFRSERRLLAAIVLQNVVDAGFEA